MGTIEVRKTIFVIAAVLLLAAGMLMATGCTQQTTPADTQEAPSEGQDNQREEQENIVVIGEESEDALGLEVENATGKTITALSVKVSTEAEYPASLMTAGQNIKSDQKALIYVDPSMLTSKAEGSGDGRSSDIILRTLYNAQLTFSDGQIVELHEVNFTDLGDIKLCLSEEGLAYIEYTNTSGKAESTLESEKAFKAAVEAQAQAEAQATAEAEAAAQAEAEAAAAAQQNSQQYEYSYDYGSSGGGSGSSSSQTDDQCVEDVILR